MVVNCCCCIGLTAFEETGALRDRPEGGTEKSFKPASGVEEVRAGCGRGEEVVVGENGVGVEKGVAVVMNGEETAGGGEEKGRVAVEA